jgi:ADP-heptose:LPS heptosyltransferase
VSETNFLLIQLRQIGDVVLTTPVARILKQAQPGCRVAFLTEAPSHELLQGNPFIDEVLLNDRRGGIRSHLRLARDLRGRRFDVVIDFMANPRSALLAFFSGAPRRISYDVRGRGILYTHRVPTEPGYAVEIKKSLLGPLGIESAWDRPEIFLADGDKQWGLARREELLAGREGRLITIDPSHRRATRRWPAAHFGVLCRLLSETFAAVPVVLRGPGEEAIAREVVLASGDTAVLSPPTTLRQMAALVAAADLHLGNCSAPRHIALGVRTPSFTVLGSSSTGWTHRSEEHADQALGLDCQPCKLRDGCSRNVACLEDLTPEEVFSSVSTWAPATLGWDNS